MVSINLEYLNDSFDVSFVLSSLYLWLLFGLSSSLLNCDIQKYLLKNTLYLYISTFIGFFFLFTIMDDKKIIPIHYLWLKTFLVYILFIMLIKSKWYFSIPIIMLLLADQSIIYHIKYMEQENNLENMELLKDIRYYINIVIIVITIIGFIEYNYVKYREHKNTFSIKDLLLSRCNIK